MGFLPPCLDFFLLPSMHQWKPRSLFIYICLIQEGGGAGGRRSAVSFYSVSPFLPATLLKSFMLVVEMGVPVKHIYVSKQFFF